MAATMNGVEKVSDLCYLKIKGISKLNKELHEVKNLNYKRHDNLA